MDFCLYASRYSYTSKKVRKRITSNLRTGPCGRISVPFMRVTFNKPIGHNEQNGVKTWLHVLRAGPCHYFNHAIYKSTNCCVCVRLLCRLGRKGARISSHFTNRSARKAGLYKAHFCNCMYHAVIGYHRLSKQAVSNIQMATRNVTQIPFWRGSAEFDL